MVPALAAAEVARVDIVSRRDVLAGRAFGSTGAYEVIVGKIHFVVDPANPRNKVVTDLDKAPRNAAGLVEMTADLSILKPKDAVQGNGVALIDIVNRGRKTVLTGFNRAAASVDLSTEAEFGDGLLLRQGFTLVWVGWEFDVPRRDGVVRVDVPVATGTTSRRARVFHARRTASGLHRRRREQLHAEGSGGGGQHADGARRHAGRADRRSRATSGSWPATS